LNIERFVQLIEDPSRSKADLIAMRENAFSKNSIEHVSLVERVLDTRHPAWRSTASKRGGSKPTEVMFMKVRRSFPTEKEAYVWLMERFITHYPKPFNEIDWETRFVAKGARTLYFAKSLKNLFKTSPDLASDPTKYHRLTNGWFAKLVLSEKQKFELLTKFATVAHLCMGADWDWDDRAATMPALSADDLLRELEETPAGTSSPPAGMRDHR
jgi:hypothetical protein